MPRKEKQYHYLYKTTNLINNKFYVGMHSTDNLEDEYLGSGKRLRYSIRKYGKENFIKEILSFFKDREELIVAEIDMVNDELIKNEHCMNIMNGGKGGYVNEEVQFKRSQAGGLKRAQNLTRERIKEISSLAGNISKIKKVGIFDINFIKYDWNGKQHTEETKNKISQSLKNKGCGETNNSFGTCWIMNDIENKRIKKEDLEIYLAQGWIKGAKFKK